MRRRDVIAGLAGLGCAVAPLPTRAQTMPVIGFLRNTRAEDSTELLSAFHQGLKESGYVEGQNVAVEYRWANGQADRLPALAAELVRRPVALILCGGNNETKAAKGATST